MCYGSERAALIDEIVREGTHQTLAKALQPKLRRVDERKEMVPSADGQ
jgi:hypothetical protein